MPCQVPSASLPPAMGSRAGRGQRGLQVRGHVVRALGVMRVERIAFGHQAVQPALEVALRARVGVLLDHQARRGVPQKAVHSPSSTPALLTSDNHLRSDVVQTLPGRVETELLNHSRALRAPPPPAASCLRGTRGTRRRRWRCTRCVRRSPYLSMAASVSPPPAIENALRRGDGLRQRLGALGERHRTRTRRPGRSRRWCRRSASMLPRSARRVSGPMSRIISSAPTSLDRA